jgi:hypothetical protein
MWDGWETLGGKMINLSFTLSNPFSSRYSSVYDTSGKTWMPHKFWEFGIYKNSAIIGFSFDLTMRQDHAGFGFSFELFGWRVDYRFYDSRHWNDETECWEVYE